MGGYYGYSGGPTDTEELWTEIRKLRTKISDLEKELHTHRHGYRWQPSSHNGTPYLSSSVKDLDV